MNPLSAPSGSWKCRLCMCLLQTLHQMKVLWSAAQQVKQYLIEPSLSEAPGTSSVCPWASRSCKPSLYFRPPAAVSVDPFAGADCGEGLSTCVCSSGSDRSEALAPDERLPLAARWPALSFAGPASLPVHLQRATARERRLSGCQNLCPELTLVFLG